MLAAVNDRASELFMAGDPDGARALFEQVIEVGSEALGPNHALVLGAMANLAVVLRERPDLDAARGLAERLLACGDGITGSAEPPARTAVDHVGRLLSELGERPRALALFAAAAQARRRVLGPAAPATIEAASRAAGLESALGDLEAAHRRLEPLLEAALHVHGADADLVLGVLDNLTDVLVAADDAAGLGAAFGLAVAHAERTAGADSTALATLYERWANAMARVGEDSAADVYAARARAIRARYP